MTSTLIEFKYSNDAHMVSIFIRSDTPQFSFIPFLLKSVAECEYTNRKRNWGYTVAEIVSKIVQENDAGVSFIPESEIGRVGAIHRYEITVPEDLYSKSSNSLHDFLVIKEIDKDEPFIGLLKDFSSKIVELNNSYMIQELEDEIKEKTESLDKLRDKLKGKQS